MNIAGKFIEMTYLYKCLSKAVLHESETTGTKSVIGFLKNDWDRKKIKMKFCSGKC